MKDLDGFYAALEEEKNIINGSFFHPARRTKTRHNSQTFRELQIIAEALKIGSTVATTNMQIVNVVKMFEIPVKAFGVGWIIGWIIG